MSRKTVSIRLTDAETQTLGAAAARAGVGLSVYVRNAALEAAGGVSSEWREKAPEPPVWAAGLIRAVKRALRAELGRTQRQRAEVKRARGSRRARH
jgi:hypothetical protein